MPSFPTPVYDIAQGDCYLKGKSVQIKAYLKKLKTIADGCKKELPAQWKKTKQAKKDLDVTVDALPAPEPDVHFFAASPSCNDLSAQSFEADDISDSSNAKAQYSVWLDTIANNTKKYCTMVHDVIKPLADACASMATEVQCQLNMSTANGISDQTKKAYRSTITMAMKKATQQYNALDSFYKKTLSVAGWGNFTSLYKESNITCGNAGMGSDSYTKEEE